MSLPPKRQPSRGSPEQQVTADYSDPPAPSVHSQPRRSVALGSMVGKYKVYAVLGYGGMGSVYAAKDPLIERDVAIKILPPELVRDPATLQRFLGEARAAGKLNHPHIVTIYEVIQIEGGGYAIVMERVNGGSIQEYLVKKGPPGWRAATRLIGEACKALAAAHEAGLVHRDIKPANLLLTSDGHVKVADFGLVKTDGADATLQTQPGAILGTPAYMSPEQCRGDKIDRRSDIYSLGCTYFAMLTSRPPFEAPSSMQVMFAHCSAPIPDPRSLDVEVPQACVEILTKALAKNPEDRYQTARDFLKDLRTALGGGTIAVADPMALSSQLSSVPDPPAMPIPEPVVRRSDLRGRLIAAGAAAVAVVVLALVLMRVWPSKPAPQAAVVPPPVPTTPRAALPAVAQNGSRVQAPSTAPTALPVAPVAVLPLAVSHPKPTVAPPSANTVVQSPVPVAPAPPPLPPSQPRPAAVSRPPEPVSSPPPAPRPLWRNDPQLPLSLTNSIGMKLRLVRPGTFTMGDDTLPNAPRHQVTLTRPYYMGVYEVSGGEYRAIMGDRAIGSAPRDDLPAAFVSWDDATEFCRRLNERPEEQCAKRFYRLPTEAEWECACRAGTTSRYAFGNVLRPTEANFGKSLSIAKARPTAQDGRRPGPPPDGQGPPPPDGPPDGGAPSGAGGSDGPGGGGQQRGPFQRRPGPNGQHPLEPRGRYQPNAWGLYDMEGSLWEWCSDFYDPGFDLSKPQTDPTGAPSGATHVARGGCWASTARECASAYRNGKTGENADRPIYGFRVVCQIRADGPPPP